MSYDSLLLRQIKAEMSPEQTGQSRCRAWMISFIVQRWELELLHPPRHTELEGLGAIAWKPRITCGDVAKSTV